jgi:hypothetical protein
MGRVQVLVIVHSRSTSVAFLLFSINKWNALDPMYIGVNNYHILKPQNAGMTTFLILSHYWS